MNRNTLLLCGTIVATIVISEAIGKDSGNASNVDALDLAARGAFEERIDRLESRANEVDEALDKIAQTSTTTIGYIQHVADALRTKRKIDDDAAQGVVKQLGDWANEMTTIAQNAKLRTRASESEKN